MGSCLQIFRKSKLTQTTMLVETVEKLCATEKTIKGLADRFGKYLITLGNAGTLNIWDCKRLESTPSAREDANLKPRLILLHSFASTDLSDFVIQNSGPQLAIFGVTSNCLQIIVLPLFKITHSMPIPHAFIVPDLSGSLILMEWDQLEIIVRKLAETAPSQKFALLLLEKRYDEAQRFADEFDLQKDVVLRAKFEDLLDQMKKEEPWCQPKDLDAAVDQLALDLQELEVSA